MGHAFAAAGHGHRLGAVLRNRPVLAMAAASLATGFAQFVAVAALGDVAAAFGERAPDDGTLAGAAGLSFTTLGLGLAAIRLASLAGLPLAGSADRFGRRRTLLAFLVVGLALTAAAATSQSFWTFVAAFALARPGLSAVNAIAGVIAAEETATRHRSGAMAVVAVGYGTGSGSAALLRGLAGEALGFRGLFAIAAVLGLVVVPLLARLVREPARFRQVAHRPPGSPRPVWGPLRRGLRLRTGVLSATTFSVAFVTAPATGLLFVYGENVLELDPALVGTVVVAAAPLGLLGLLVGRLGSDRLGRRPTAALSQVAIGLAAAGTYTGSPAALIGGYLLVLATSSAYAPATGSLAAELFPTTVRASAAGWLTVAGVLGAVSGLLVFGLAADWADAAVGGAMVVAVPAVLCAAAFWLVPETRDGELRDT